jgi:hypothetical protein
VNVKTANDHVGELERSIRTIKERVQATLRGLSYSYIPREMMKGVVNFAVKSLNQFPALHGISTSHSPKIIVTGSPPME